MVAVVRQRLPHARRPPHPVAVYAQELDTAQGRGGEGGEETHRPRLVEFSVEGAGSRFPLVLGHRRRGSGPARSAGRGRSDLKADRRPSTPERLFVGTVMSATGGLCHWSPACKFRFSHSGSWAPFLTRRSAGALNQAKAVPIHSKQAEVHSVVVDMPQVIDLSSGLTRLLGRSAADPDGGPSSFTRPRSASSSTLIAYRPPSRRAMTFSFHSSVYAGAPSVAAGGRGITWWSGISISTTKPSLPQARSIFPRN